MCLFQLQHFIEKKQQLQPQQLPLLLPQLLQQQQLQQLQQQQLPQLLRPLQQNQMEITLPLQLRQLQV